MEQKTISGKHALELTFKMNEWLQFNPRVIIKSVIFNDENTEAIAFFKEKV